MEQKLAAAIQTMEQAIEADRHSVPKTWQQNRVALDRATDCVIRLVARASAIDRISARRELKRILQPPADSTPASVAAVPLQQ
jgi:hypothetical protein